MAATQKNVSSPSHSKTVTCGFVGELLVEVIPQGFRITHPARFHRKIHAWIKEIGGHWHDDCWIVVSNLEVGLAQRLQRYQRDCERTGKSYTTLATALAKEKDAPLSFNCGSYRIELKLDTYCIRFPSHPRIVQALMAVPGKRFIPPNEEWHVPVTSYDAFAPFARRLKATAELATVRSPADEAALAKEAAQSLKGHADGVKVGFDGRVYTVTLKGNDRAHALMTFVDGAHFDNKKRTWTVPVASYDVLAGALLRIRALHTLDMAMTEPAQASLL